jgi:hypothetical protein
MFNNDLQWVNLGVRQNTELDGVEWSPMSGSWRLQELVREPDKLVSSNTQFTHPLSAGFTIPSSWKPLRWEDPETFFLDFGFVSTPKLSALTLL